MLKIAYVAFVSANYAQHIAESQKVQAIFHLHMVAWPLHMVAWPVLNGT